MLRAGWQVAGELIKNQFKWGDNQNRRNAFLDYRDWDQKKGGTDFGGRSVSVNPDSLLLFYDQSEDTLHKYLT